MPICALYNRWQMRVTTYCQLESGESGPLTSKSALTVAPAGDLYIYIASTIAAKSAEYVVLKIGSQ